MENLLEAAGRYRISEDIEWQTIETIRTEKKEEKGGFYNGVILEDVEG